MTLRVPSNCNGHRKGDLINLLDELCITSAGRPPTFKALLFTFPESDHLAPPCLNAAVQQVKKGKSLELDRSDHLTESASNMRAEFVKCELYFARARAHTHTHRHTHLE